MNANERKILESKIICHIFDRQIKLFADLNADHFSEPRLSAFFDAWTSPDFESVAHTFNDVIAGTAPFAHELNNEYFIKQLIAEDNRERARGVLRSLQDLKVDNFDEMLRGLNKAQEELTKISMHGTGTAVPITLVAERVLHDAITGDDEKLGSRQLFFKTGFHLIDSYLDGFGTKRIVLIGARPGMGKTSLGISLLAGVSSRGHRACYFSQEMSVDEVMTKYFAAMGHIDAKSLTQAGFQNLSDSEYDRFETALQVSKKVEPLVDELAMPYIESLVREIRRHAVGSEVRIFFIDYMQQIEVDPRNRDLARLQDNQKLSYIGKRLKALSKELNICIVILSQLNRGTELSSAPPTAANLKGSGSLEEDADQIILIHKTKEDEDSPYAYFVKVQKNRHGAESDEWIPVEARLRQSLFISNDGLQPISKMKKEKPIRKYKKNDD